MHDTQPMADTLLIHDIQLMADTLLIHNIQLMPDTLSIYDIHLMADTLLIHDIQPIIFIKLKLVSHNWAFSSIVIALLFTKYRQVTELTTCMRNKCCT